MIDKGEKCLVVSRLKETWDLTTELLFISESVVDYNEREGLKKIRHHILDNIWCNIDYELKAIEFIENKARRYREDLAQVLNNVHGVDYSQSYWGILLDSWLINFLSVAYDRLNKVNHACVYSPNIFIKTGDAGVDLPPETSWDFMFLSQSDEFNQIVYVEAARFLGLRIEAASRKISHDKVKVCKGSSAKENFYHYAKFIVRRGVENIICILNPVLIVDGYFTKSDAFQIALRSLGKVIILPSRLLFQESRKRATSDESGRNIIRVQENERFDVFVNALLKYCFPMSFLENYGAQKLRTSHWLDSVSVLGTATAIRSNDTYKIAAAEVHRRNGKLLGFQHGGGYQFFKKGHYDYIETGYVNRYFNWGFKFSNGLGTPKLRKLDKMKDRLEGLRGSARDSILFVGTNHTRFLFWQNVKENANCFTDYIAEQYSFYRDLSDKNKKRFVLRPYIQDFGWRYNERWIDEFDDTVVFDAEKDFSKSLETSRIYVTDHISTTWLEALYVDMPIVMYFDVDRYGLLDDVKEIIIQLTKVGVVHETPMAAAEFINKIYEDVDAWWQALATQEAVKKLKDYTISESENFVAGWTRELVSFNDD